MTWGSVYYYTYHSVLVFSVTAKVMHVFKLSALVVAIVMINCRKCVILVTWERVCYCTYHSVLVCSVTAKVCHGFNYELSVSALVVVARVVINCEKMCNSSNLVALAG